MPLLSAGSAGSTLYYTMRLVEGESLRSRLARESRLGIREAVEIARDIVESGIAIVTVQLVLKQSAPFAALERARAWDHVGDTARAVHFYRDFLRMYDMPPEQHAPYIREAESAIVRLSGGRDP